MFALSALASALDTTDTCDGPALRTELVAQEGFASPDVVAHLLSSARTIPAEQWAAGCNDTALQAFLPVTEVVEPLLRKLGEAFGINISSWGSLPVQKTSMAAAERVHTDLAMNVDGSGSAHAVSALLYLAVPEGAALSFPAAAAGPLEVRPTPGMLVSFPNDGAYAHARSGSGERLFMQFPIEPGSAVGPRHFCQRGPTLDIDEPDSAASKTDDVPSSPPSAISPLPSAGCPYGCVEASALGAPDEAGRRPLFSSTPQGCPAGCKPA